MPSIINSDDGVVSGTSGLKTTGGNDGVLNIQTNGTNAISISSGQRSTFPTTIGVGGATPSTSGSGITFPATASASSNANTLDDYEEGTWTPVLTFGGGSTSLTYSNQVGYYTKIGNTVTVQYNIFLSNKGTSTGNNLISGLPFTTTNDSARRNSAYQFTDRVTPHQLLTIENSTTFNLQTLSTGTGSSAATLTHADFVNNTYISGTFTYLI
jgi:hypothetical protein